MNPFYCFIIFLIAFITAVVATNGWSSTITEEFEIGPISLGQDKPAMDFMKGISRPQGDISITKMSLRLTDENGAMTIIIIMTIPQSLGFFLTHIS